MGSVGEVCSDFSPKFQFPEKRLRDVLFVLTTTDERMLSHHSQIALPGNGLLESVSYRPSPLPTALVT